MDIRRDATPDAGGGHRPDTEGTPRVDIRGGHVPMDRGTPGVDTEGGHVHVAGATPGTGHPTPEGTPGHVHRDTPPDVDVPVSGRADVFLTGIALLAVILAASLSASRAVPHAAKALIFLGALGVLFWLLWTPAARVLARWRAEAAGGQQ